ncbi:MAG: hypothetical protein AAGF95_16730 [Chloroflexota bacterium]
MKTSPTLLPIGILCSLIIGFVITFSTLSEPNETDPINIIRAFAEDPELELIPEPDTTELPGTNEQTFTTPDKSATFTVDMDHHQVVSAVMSPSDDVQQGSSQITADVAHQTAQSFATTKIPSLQEIQLQEQSVSYHEETIATYFYTWAEHLGSEQAQGLEHVAITVDAQTGAIISFQHLPAIPITVDVEPSITRAEAIAIAEKEFAAPTTEVETSLSVW